MAQTGTSMAPRSMAGSCCFCYVTQRQRCVGRPMQRVRVEHVKSRDGSIKQAVLKSGWFQADWLPHREQPVLLLLLLQKGFSSFVSFLPSDAFVACFSQCLLSLCSVATRTSKKLGQLSSPVSAAAVCCCRRRPLGRRAVGCTAAAGVCGGSCSGADEACSLCVVPPTPPAPAAPAGPPRSAAACAAAAATASDAPACACLRPAGVAAAVCAARVPPPGAATAAAPLILGGSWCPSSTSWRHSASRASWRSISAACRRSTSAIASTNCVG